MSETEDQGRMLRIIGCSGEDGFTEDAIVRLSRLVQEERESAAREEREACARIADENERKSKAAAERFAHPDDGDEDKEIAHSKRAAMARLIAAGIRARSQEGGGG